MSDPLLKEIIEEYLFDHGYRRNMHDPSYYDEHGVPGTFFETVREVLEREA